MELLWLKYFQELAHSEHLSQTAEKLHISQPSLSQTLKRLETELGVPLFDRVGKKITLNAYGRTVLKYTEQIFSSLDNINLELASQRRTESKTVALYVYAASMLLPDIVRRIRKEDPDIRLRIFQQPVDLNPAPPTLCISASPACPQNNHTVALLRENILAAIPKNHPLAESASLTLADLKKEQFLSLTPSSSLAQTIRYYCEQYGFQPDNTTYVQNPALMRDLLKINMGIAFVPEYSWSGLTADAVCFRRITDFPMERYLQLSWDENTYQTPSLQLCRQTIIRYFKEYSSQFPGEPEV